MSLLRTFALPALALAGIALLTRSQQAQQARPAPAYSPKARREAGTAGPDSVRPAGPESMRDAPRRWDKVDEAADQSFPASDPPSTY